jgi:talin
LVIFRYGQNDEFIQAVRTTSDAVSALIENAAQAAYLIGISDPSSVVGKAGIIDHREMADAVQGIQDASRVMTSSAPATQQQMLQAATVIAKYSHTLCSSCRTASSRSSNPVAKRQFVQVSHVYFALLSVFIFVSA